MKLTIELIYDDSDAQPGWFVRVVEKPGCMSQGDTIAEAIRAWDEAGQASEPGVNACVVCGRYSKGRYNGFPLCLDCYINRPDDVLAYQHNA